MVELRGFEPLTPSMRTRLALSISSWQSFVSGSSLQVGGMILMPSDDGP